ncbi:hypothetical protein CC78DRAFT_510957 [Lojkania enalia]|uniref:Brl1/Brr6 domain-containing protein n=1 Tax=Lojkania enalia TaxID=147567 RepID=A0A9P4N811_9PLEO|nr:hypothetical protein CC78DRAFT_510957 [Didymosphaeria enalia]
MAWNRDSTAPMDFEYENSIGRVDENSPFVSNFAPAKKRSRSVFDSPSKTSGFSTPNRPHLRDPNNQPYLFSQQSNAKPLPAVPSHVSSTWELRTPSKSIYDSSDGGTPNTPGLNEDSEAGATPDTQPTKKMSALSIGPKGESPVKRRESWVRKYILRSSPSPKKENSDHFSKKAEHRVRKRRTKTKQVAVREEDNSENEQSKAKNSALARTALAPPGMAEQMGSFFTFLEAHPDLPSVLSFYLQLLVNVCLACFFLYILYQAWSSVMSDVEIESNKNVAEIMVEIAACAKQYRENHCDPTKRVPAMETLCGNWEACMKRDPRKVARASVTARTFAMIFNAFVEEFSYKSMIFTAIILIGGFNLSNWAFGVLRSKSSSHHNSSINYPPPPATPQRYPSGGFLPEHAHQFQHGWNNTPYQTPYGSMNANMMHQASQSMPTLPGIEDRGIEDRTSPSKRLVFR